jgi:phosphatidylserine/phosphatidylglycerophosphate/cardiolipin synthase-like enzyme
MKLLVQPTDGILPLIQGIEKAQRSIHIVIFRFDRTDIERALENAVARGVAVHALIAYLNRGGEKKLRKLEMRFLEAGVSVARTSNDLIRYHDKLMIIDETELYVLAFNFTYLDIEHSRSFGVVTNEAAYVQEALNLFEADTQRRRYVPGFDNFVVSPVNARRQLESFLGSAKQELLIYDPKISDPSMISLLAKRAQEGVEVRILGRITHRIEGVMVHNPPVHLHARTMVRDRRDVFIGSQSLCAAELDARREVGIISDDKMVADGVIRVFEEDWMQQDPIQDIPLMDEENPASKAAKKAVKAIARELPPMVPILEEAVRKVVGADAEIKLDAEQVEETVRGAIKEVIKDVVKDAIHEAVEQQELERSKA